MTGFSESDNYFFNTGDKFVYNYVQNKFKTDKKLIFQWV